MHLNLERIRSHGDVHQFRGYTPLFAYQLLSYCALFCNEIRAGAVRSTQDTIEVR